MSKINYIAIPEETPDSRNDGFYKEISRDWKKRAKDLQHRRWEKIER
jgi:hypothetical protein